MGLSGFRPIIVSLDQLCESCTVDTPPDSI